MKAKPGGRLRREPGGRKRVVQVKVSEAEWAAVSEKAETAGVSAPRFLLESALLGSGQSVSERRSYFYAFMAARRAVSGAATNVNQLAHVANATGQVLPAEVVDAVSELRRLAEVLEADAERLTDAVLTGWRS